MGTPRPDRSELCFHTRLGDLALHPVDGPAGDEERMVAHSGRRHVGLFQHGFAPASVV